MAARQDQTLQIFLIVFIFLFLVVSVVAYLGWRGKSDAEQKTASMQTTVNEKTQQMQTQTTELEDMREKMGFGRNDNTADIMKTAKADMDTYGGGIPDEASRTYRKVLETVFADGQQTAAREAKLKIDISGRDKQLAAVQAETDKQIKDFKDAREKAEADRAAESAKFGEDRKALEKTKADLQKSLQDQRTKYEGDIATRDASIKDLSEKNSKLEHAVANLIENRKDEPESFEVADGRISWVNQNGTVWINLGTGDSLRRQVTFSVFDADLHDAAKSKKKASIEVTRLLSDHMAEARITSDDLTNPILTGDKIYSQIWHRGKKLHFALTGFIDIDGDGQSDLDLARELIELNGGIVDAYLDEKGKIQGDITANTRYLVSGESPDKVPKAGLQQATNQMFKTAASLGVETITMPEFLSQMGYKPQDRTVNLGAGASARDFPATPLNDDSGRKATRFRQREAPSTTAPIKTAPADAAKDKP